MYFLSLALWSIVLLYKYKCFNKLFISSYRKLVIVFVTVFFRHYFLKQLYKYYISIMDKNQIDLIKAIKNGTIQKETNALIDAIKNGNIETIKLMILSNPNIFTINHNKKEILINFDNYTPLYDYRNMLTIALEYHQYKVFTLLISLGFIPDSKTFESAIKVGNIDALNILTTKYSTYFRDSDIFIAMKYKEWEMASIMLQKYSSSKDLLLNKYLYTMNKKDITVEAVKMLIPYFVCDEIGDNCKIALRYANYLDNKDIKNIIEQHIWYISRKNALIFFESFPYFIHEPYNCHITRYLLDIWVFRDICTYMGKPIIT